MNSTQVFMIAVPEDTRESAPQAVAAAMLAPARALSPDRPGKTTTALGLVAPGYAADCLLSNPGEVRADRHLRRPQD